MATRDGLRTWKHQFTRPYLDIRSPPVLLALRPTTHNGARWRMPPYDPLWQDLCSPQGPRSLIQALIALQTPRQIPQQPHLSHNLRKTPHPTTKHHCSTTRPDPGTTTPAVPRLGFPELQLPGSTPHHPPPPGLSVLSTASIRLL